MLDLHYEEPAGWFPIPAWADFFYRMGYVTAQEERPSTTVVIVPDAAGVMPFMALGTVAGCWQNKDDFALSRDLQWEMLTKLSPGTPVSYTHLSRNSGVLKLSCLRVSSDSTADYMVLEFAKGTNQTEADKYYIAKGDRAFRVMPLKTDPKLFTPDKKVKEKTAPAVLNCFFGGMLYKYFTQSTPDCLLIGTDTQLRAECSLRLGAAEGVFLGTLGDVLRIKNGNDTWHTMVCPLRNHSPQDETFRTVIFDGPSAWLRHRTDYSRSSHLVVVSHSHASLSDLLTEIRAAMSEGSFPRTVRELVSPVPYGLEVISFYRQ